MNTHPLQPARRAGAAARRALGDWHALLAAAQTLEVNMPVENALVVGLSPDAAEVWAVVTAFNRAFAANDPERYFSFVDDAITVLTPGNPYRVEGLPADREEFEFGLRAGYSRVGYFQEMQPHVAVFGNVALATYFSRGHYGPEGASRALYLKETDVLVRRPAGWRIVHIHVSAA
jgi:ketosteroid isomerase-like protein